MNAFQTLTARQLRFQLIFQICLLIGILVIVSAPALAQDPTQTTMTGAVVSYTRHALVVRVEGNHYWLFVFDSHTVRPQTLAVGSGVKVISTQTEDPTVRLAVVVTATDPSAPATTSQEAQPDIVPPSIRATESAITRDARKFHFGVQGGVALNPELVDIGIHAKFGPFFTKRASLRPSIDFAFGELTKLFSLNADVIYSLASNFGARQSIYFGLGPQFNFAQQGTSDHGVDFSEFHYSNALNVILGVRFRSGVFTELKTSVWAAPAPILRLMAGYTF